jgi:hypothetical protein
MLMIQVVSRSVNANSEFDCSALSKKKKRRVENSLAAVVAPVAAAAAVEIVCINSQGDDSTSTEDSNY